MSSPNDGRAAPPKERDPDQTVAPSSKAPRGSLPCGSDRPRRGWLFLVAGERPRQGGTRYETVTVIRRTRPAAQNAADLFNFRGWGPARIYSTRVRTWREESTS